jgi:hypothetical protein
MPNEKKQMPMARAAQKSAKPAMQKPAMQKSKPMAPKKTSATIQRIDKMSDGTMKKYPKKSMELKTISKREFDR